ncbi:type VII secretion-associated serine protease mycosin [Streptomyces triculaminicus]|uniref:type VII secretion-associated serine protease mycosin n=1 Tax=Streptomyces triculaminicus TaxID=2816232 RepID=UPI001F5EC891|nr:type VII secretion-associated serine protease mycosin [Streptomyces triculaminicus]
MRAEEIWKTSTGTGVTVAVIDSGVDATLPDLRGQVLEGRDFTGRGDDGRTDAKGHGSRMAMFIAATGKGDGTWGLAPGAKILPLRASGTRDAATSGAAIGSAVRFAADSDAKVINISLARTAASREEADAVAYALSKGKLIFAGVGNDGDTSNLPQYPSATPGVIGVSAVDQDIKAASWSQYGPQVDLAAPGTNMVAPCTDGTSGLCIGDGTSDATALASASAALVWSAHPDWTANQVLRVLINTAGGPKSGEKRSDSLGYGVVRPRIALQNPGDPGPRTSAPSPNWPQPPRRSRAPARRRRPPTTTAAAPAPSRPAPP